MLELFRNNNFIFTLLLIPYAIFLRFLPIYFRTNESFEAEGLWLHWMFGEEIRQSIWIQIIALLLIFFQAAMVNRIVIKNRMTNELTLFPGVFYILLVSFFPGYVGLSPILVANTFILIALEQMFVSHKKFRTAEHLFSVGFWFSIAAITYYGYFLFMLFPLIGLSMLRTVKWMNWLQFLIGLVTPILIFVMLSILRDNPPMIIFSEWWEKSGSFDFYFSKDWLSFLQLGFFGMWILASFLQYNAYTVKKNIHAQKKIDLCFWLMTFALIAVSFMSDIRSTDLVFLSIPLSITIAMSFLRFKSKVSSEMIHFLMIISLFTIQVVTYF